MMSLKSNLKKKGMLSFYTCDECSNPICKCVIERVRNQENALVVAKQAIESLETLNTKLTMDIEGLKKKNAVLKESVQQKFWKDVKGKQNKIDQQFQRFNNRDSLIQ